MPKFLIKDGKVVAFTPPTPNFKTRTIGFELVVVNVHIKQFRAAVRPRTAGADAAILNREDEPVELGGHAYHVLNGEVFRLLGIKHRRAYFKHPLSRQVVAAPPATDGNRTPGS